MPYKHITDKRVNRMNRYYRNIERSREIGRLDSIKRNRIHREYVIQQKDKPCADCGVKYPWYVMHFDHVDDNKKFTIGQWTGRISFAALKEEIAKCEVVCANCHAVRTWSRANAGKEL